MLRALRRDVLLGGVKVRANVDQDLFVVSQTKEQTIGDRVGDKTVRRSQRLAVLRHLVGTVQGGPQRGFFRWRRCQPASLATALEQLAERLRKRLAGFQIECPFQKQKLSQRRAHCEIGNIQNAHQLIHGGLS